MIGVMRMNKKFKTLTRYVGTLAVKASTHSDMADLKTLALEKHIVFNAKVRYIKRLTR